MSQSKRSVTLKLGGFMAFVMTLTSTPAFAILGVGDQISTTIDTAGGYLQKIALGIFIILLTIGALRVATDPEHRSGVGQIVGCIIGILVVVLAPTIVDVVSSWSGGVLGF